MNPSSGHPSNPEGYSPQLGGERSNPFSGHEPGLGAGRRPKLNRDLFFRLLEIEPGVRAIAIEEVIDGGMGRAYGAAMIAVLSPDARHFELGRLWKVPYSYERKLAAIHSLMHIYPEGALKGLITALNNDDLSLQQAAIWFMGQLDGTSAEGALVAALRDRRPQLRRSAMQALAECWGQPYLRGLSSPMAWVVVEAAQWLGEHEGQRVLPVLQAAFYDQRPGGLNQEQAQTAIMRAWGQLGHRLGGGAALDAVRMLREVIDERRFSRELRLEALDSLQAVGTEEALAAVIVYQAELR